MEVPIYFSRYLFYVDGILYGLDWIGLDGIGLDWLVRLCRLL